jgi:PTS system nitrogen regulatory IIA component
MLLTVSEVAQHLDVTDDTVWKWVQEGSIPFSKVNDQVRLSSAEVLEWAIARGHRVSSKAMSRQSLRGKGPTLEDALRGGGVHRLEGPVSRDALFAALVGGCDDLAGEDKATLLSLLEASESLGPTGLGDGIAIPHVRSPIVLQGAPARLAVWYLAEPVGYFRSPDGKPVEVVFFLVTPNPRAHLHLVSLLMMALHDEGFAQAARQRAPIERLLELARGVDEASAALAVASAAVRGGP